jgi:hypothetical protein
MTKVKDSLKLDEYNAGAYLSLTEFLNYYGITDEQIQNLPGATVTKYKDWVNNANRTVETALYKYNDGIPLEKTNESFTYAKTMAMHWAQYEKAADEGSSNVKAKENIWKMDKEQLIQVLKAQPQKTTTRAVTGSNFTENEVDLYSQTYGVKDLL